MTPDLATIARRRHVAMIVLRTAVVLWVVWTLWLSMESVVANMGMVAHLGDLPGSSVLTWALDLGLPLVIRLMLAAIVVFMEKRLVRWIVPLGDRGGECPRCGYVLKDLKSPVCPECGLDLRPGA
jgi:hypothetical protein